MSTRILAAMTQEIDNQDQDDEAPPYGEGLWEDVRFWFDAILSVFGDLRELMHVGVTRSLAVKLCNWLWGVEGAVRRLILAEALKLDPEVLAGLRPRAGNASKAREARTRRPSFRIFGFNRQAETAPQLSTAATPKADLPAHWHIPFPSDPLLSIGPRFARQRASSARRTNPIDRRGLTRGDPDYWLYREEEPYDPLLFGRSGAETRPTRPRPEPVLTQDRPSHLFFRADPSDWKRVEEEWKRVIPAPHLAARVFALVKVMDNRTSVTARLARFFARCRDRIADIFSQPPPELAWPRQAKLIHRCREVEALVPRSWAELVRLDTS